MEGTVFSFLFFFFLFRFSVLFLCHLSPFVYSLDALLHPFFVQHF